MELCVLPSTGADAGIWAFVILAAVAAIVLGVVMLGRGASRRRVATCMGALAAVGIVALGSVGAAPSAFADSGTRDCVTQPTTPAPPPAPPAAAPATPVTPTFPTVAAQCGVDSIVTLPTQTGVAYTQSRSGSVVTVTAAAATGFVIPSGVQSVFQYDVAPAPLAPWPVDLPERETATLAGGDEFATYLEPSDPELVPALQSAQDAGQLTYALDAEQFGFTVQVDAIDEETSEVVATEQVLLRLPSELSYDFVEGLYVLTIDPEGANPEEELLAQLEAIEARYPGTVAEPRIGEGEVPVLGGLQIDASYVPAPACDPVTATVAIDFALSPIDDAPSSLGAAIDAAAAAAPDAPTSAATQAPAVQAPTEEDLTLDAPTAAEPAEAPAVDETEAVVTQD